MARWADIHGRPPISEEKGSGERKELREEEEGEEEEGEAGKDVK